MEYSGHEDSVTLSCFILRKMGGFYAEGTTGASSDSLLFWFYELVVMREVECVPSVIFIHLKKHI